MNTKETLKMSFTMTEEEFVKNENRYVCTLYTRESTYPILANVTYSFNEHYDYVAHVEINDAPRDLVDNMTSFSLVFDSLVKNFNRQNHNDAIAA